eukprot:531609-Pyramimonas_sp.AAC.2
MGGRGLRLQVRARPQTAHRVPVELPHPYLYLSPHTPPSAGQDIRPRRPRSAAPVPPRQFAPPQATELSIRTQGPWKAQLEESPACCPALQEADPHGLILSPPGSPLFGTGTTATSPLRPRSAWSASTLTKVWAQPATSKNQVGH